MGNFVDINVKIMSHSNCVTDITLKTKAKELFFQHGKLNSTTQEIADFAGVKRTLVNYYFGSKKELFNLVYQEAIDEMRNQLESIYLSAHPFREKVELLIDFLIEFRDRYPFLEVFNIQETINIQNAVDTIVRPSVSESTKHFVKEIEAEMQKGTIKVFHPLNFLMVIFSLISFPVVMRPILRSVFDLDEIEYTKMNNQRKEITLNLLFN